METKKVSYAYATSAHADQYNHGKGCWLVQHFFDDVCTSVKVFSENELNPIETKEAAFWYANAIPCDYDRWSVKPWEAK